MKVTAPTVLIFFFVIRIHSLTAQTIRVTDEDTRRPISDVFIFHESKDHISYTDEKGVADVSDFPVGSIYLQHPTYRELVMSYKGEDLLTRMKEKVLSYNEVVISANKWEQEEEHVSQQILSVNKKTIQFQNPQTSADLLANTGQVFVQKSQLGGGSPKIRGFAANSVLLVVDGIRMNNAIFRSGNLQNIINIDPNALESSEVIFGPGSVIYGSDALGGVMDFHTINPRWSTDDVPDVSANALARYSSAANERTGHIDFSLSGKKFTLFHSTTFTAFDDLRAGTKRRGGYKNAFRRDFYVKRINGTDQLVANDDENIQRFSGYNLFNSISKVKHRLGSHADISYGFYYSTTSDIPRYDNLTETIGDTDSLEAAAWYYGPQTWEMHALRLNLYPSNPLFDQARLTLSYQNFQESRNDRNFGYDRLRTRTEQVDMYATSLDFDKELKNSNLYYGVDFFYNDVASDGYRKHIETGQITPATSRYPDGGSSFSSLACYASYVRELSPDITLNSGLRYSMTRLSATTRDSLAQANNASDLSQSNGAVNGALGLVYRVNENHKLSTHVSSGFRAPNIDDVGKLFESGNRLIVPNSDLRPEYTISYELGYEKKTEKSFFHLVGFYSRLFDAILDGSFTLNGQPTFQDEDGEMLDVFAKVNAGRAEVYGGSLQFTTALSDQWVFASRIGYTGGRDLTNDEPLRHTTPVFGRSSVTFRSKKLKTELFLLYNTDRSRDQIPSAEIDGKPYLYTADGSPGWCTINLLSQYQCSRHVRIQAGIENILDIHYRPYSSGISAPGRNVILSLRANI